MKNPSQEELRKVDRTARLRQSLKDGVVTDEFGRRNPHVGFARCVHGKCVYACEICREKQ